VGKEVKGQSNVPRWWLKRGTDIISGLGIAPYSTYNPRSSFNNAFRRAVEDLNSNRLTLVYSMGSRISEGPFKMNQKYGIKTYYNSDDVTKIDSIVWNGNAFMLVADSSKSNYKIQVFKRNNPYQPKKDSTGTPKKIGQWRISTGENFKSKVNLYSSFTQAKQEALRKLSEKIGINIDDSIYEKNNILMDSLHYESIVGFKDIHVVNRIWTGDSVYITIAVKSGNILEH